MHTLTLYGQPMGKPRQTRSDRWKQRACVVRYRLWADELRLAAKRTTKIRLTEPTRLDVIAYFENGTKHRAGPHTVKPDASNVLKGIEDALFENDQMLYHSSLTKFWADGGQARVVIEWG